MNISRNTISSNINYQSLNRHDGSIPVCKNKDLGYKNEPFASYLSFTGGINRLSVTQPSSLDSLIRSLIDFKGDNFEFAKHAFDKIKNHFGYGDLMHDNSRFVDQCELENTGAEFNFRTGEFQMENDACSNLSRPEIASVFWHEFEHFLQFDRMFRTKEIGIGGFLRASAMHLANAVNSKAYIKGKTLNPEKIQRAIDVVSDPTKNMNLDFWNSIIEAKGLLKKDSPEAKQAMEEFERSMSHKTYIDASCFDLDSDLPLFQASRYYDVHELGTMYNYYTDPLEIEARKVEEEFLDRYVELSNESFTPNEGLASTLESFKAIEEFMHLAGSKYGNNNLPDRFKAYIYDEIVEGYAKKSPNMLVVDCIKEANRRIKDWSTEEARNNLFKFRQRLDGGVIRLNSQQETDDFMKFADAYMNSQYSK